MTGGALRPLGSQHAVPEGFPGSSHWAGQLGAGAERAESWPAPWGLLGREAGVGRASTLDGGPSLAVVDLRSQGGQGAGVGRYLYSPRVLRKEAPQTEEAPLAL